MALAVRPGLGRVDEARTACCSVRGAMPSPESSCGSCRVRGARAECRRRSRHRERLGNTGNTGNTGSTGVIVHGRSSTSTILEDFVTSCTKASRVIGRTVDGSSTFDVVSPWYVVPNLIKTPWIQWQTCRPTSSSVTSRWSSRRTSLASSSATTNGHHRDHGQNSAGDVSGRREATFPRGGSRVEKLVQGRER